MNFDAKKFITALPSFFPTLYQELSSLGLTPTLVGGVVRDFILSGKIGKDWDVELGHPTLAFNIDQWKQLGKKLATLGRATFLPYEIIRLDLGGYQLEFSPPRTETFSSELEGKGHKNFTAEFDYKLPFEDGVKRRDFTLNAMGIRFLNQTSVEFLDPLGGLTHLQKKELHPCGMDFTKDPVRFLRAHRFSKKLGLRFGQELQTLMAGMKTGDISPAYLWSEMQKSLDPLGFLILLLDQKQGHPELALPVGPEVQKYCEELRKTLLQREDQMAWVLALAWVGADPQGWQEYFSLSKEACLRLTRWVDSTKAFRQILPESFHGEFDSVKELADFARLFDWYFTTRNLVQKNPKLPLLGLISENLPHWTHLYQFEAPKDVKHIDPPFRAKYQVWNLCQRL
ncbi:MAG TPA: hypothetical protein VNJ01_02560 [Bacteriovoracaceae bacterium]|nr:hypothetical protein [Bacteriovoracaceae bacterium]